MLERVKKIIYKNFGTINGYDRNEIRWKIGDASLPFEQIRNEHQVL